MKLLSIGVDTIWDTLTMKDTSNRLLVNTLAAVYFINIFCSLGMMIVQLSKPNQDVSLFTMTALLVYAISSLCLMIETFKNYNEKRDNSK